MVLKEALQELGIDFDLKVESVSQINNKIVITKAKEQVACKVTELDKKVVSVLDESFKYFAKDEDDKAVYAYERKPKKSSNSRHWESANLFFNATKMNPSFLKDLDCDTVLTREEILK